MRRNLNRVLSYLVAGIAAVTFAAEAQAKSYTRTCNASFLVSATTPTGARLTGATYRFTGQGTVGYYAPNTARERALTNINECIDAAWANRLGTSRPSACTPSNQVNSYPFYGLHVGVMQAVCLANPGHDQILVDLSVTYSGDTGCVPPHNNWMRVVTRAYTINCPDYDAGVLH